LGFSSYEAGLSAYHSMYGKTAGPGERGVIAGGTACLVMTCTMPLEVIMRRMQVSNRASLEMVATCLSAFGRIMLHLHA
jgi:hypothetical protein